MDCVFCKIIAGEIPSYTIYEDDVVKCFLDISPDSNGHTLIIPKKHIQDLTDMDQDTWNHILKIAKMLKRQLEEKLNIDGLTLIQNNGKIQEVKHFHLHLKPYYDPMQEIKPVEEMFEKLSEISNFNPRNTN